MTEKRTVVVSALLGLTLGALAAGCAVAGDGLSLLPTLAPTQGGPALNLPEDGLQQPTFSDLSAYEALMRPGHEGDLSAFGGGTRYWLDVDISPSPHTISGQETVRYVNTTGDTLNEVVFRLYPNILAGREVMQIGSLTVNGQPVEPALSAGSSLLAVALPSPLPSGGQVEISMLFGLSVQPDEPTDTYGRLSDLEGVLSLPSFFPLLSVYDATQDVWWREMPSPMGDPVYSESALFEVELTVPDEMVVATVGQTLDRSDNGDGTTDYHIVAGPVRDFALYMSADYEVLRGTGGGVAVNVYSLPGDEGDDVFALEKTLDALAIFNRAFGDYPYAELDVVETPTLAGGIEYPGVFVLSESNWDQTDSFMEIVIAHEVAHQWWYGVVGNDQVEEPWLDEGLAQYSVVVYFRETQGTGSADGTRKFYEQTVRDFVEEGEEDMPVGLPVTAYSEPGYQTFVYFKAPLLFSLLEETYGQDAMREFLHAYFAEYEYGVATGEGLQRTAEEVFGEDLDELFGEWVGERR